MCRLATPVVLIILLFASVGCGPGPGVGPGGKVVGGPCHDDRDCAEASECLRGGDFPGGTCAVFCGDGQACPRGTVCIDTKGGYCLQSCRRESQCRGRYDCDERSVDRSGNRDAHVCVGD